MKAIILFVGCVCMMMGETALSAAPDQRLLSLLDVLRAKNVLEQAEYRKIVDSADADSSLAVLIETLVEKGVLSREQSEVILAVSFPAKDAAPAAPAAPTGGPLRIDDRLIAGLPVAPVSLRIPAGDPLPGGMISRASARPPEPVLQRPETPAGASVAIAPRPVEMLPLRPKPPEGPLTFHLGSGAIMSMNGFIKANLIQASNESSGDDFPVFARVVGTGPESANSTGTTNKPGSFRIKTKSIRSGLTFSAPDINHKFDISSVLEFDFEGNYSITTNNNTGSIRSPTPRLRVAYVRLDTHLGKVPVFLKAGQDWSLFTSSTMPTGLDSTGVYVFQGVTWERLPGFVAGARFDLGGKWKWTLQPEAGILLALGGEGVFENPFSATPGSGIGGVFTGNVTAPGQAGISTGQREGVNSNRPHVESRVVLEFQPFAHRPNVAPSYLLASFEAADRARIFAPPYTTQKPEALQNFILKNQSLGYTAEFRFATPWSTVLGKYYRGIDLRQFFGGLAQDVFYDGPSPFGPSTALPRMRGVRSQGGFIEMQVPLSVLAGATRPALQGFSANLYYGIDTAFARDARRTGNRKAQHGVMADFVYQYNRYMQFGLEMNWTELLYTSRQGGALRGGMVGTDLRKEFTTTFMF